MSAIDEKRAVWESENYSMTVCANGVVNVRNDNYGDNEHIYSVMLADGKAIRCSCPNHIHRGAHCKHQIAVESRPIIVASATAAASSYQ